MPLNDRDDATPPNDAIPPVPSPYVDRSDANRLADANRSDDLEHAGHSDRDDDEPDERWKSRWQTVGRRRWELLWPLGVAGNAAGRVGRHWHAERRTIAVGLTAFTIATLAGLVGGVILASITGVLERFPGFIVLVPAAIGIRGNIFGAMGSRIGTSMHLGTFEFDLRKGVLADNCRAVVVLTIVESVVIGLMAWVLSLMLGRPSMGLWAFLTISVLSGLATSVVVGAAAVAVVWLARRFDWDLDSVVAPIIMVVGDVIGIPFLALASLAVVGFAVPLGIGVVSLALGAAAIVYGLSRTNRPTHSIIAESLPILSAVAILNLLAGIFVEGEIETFIEFSIFLVVLPAFLSAVGALGSIFVSRLATKIHLGTVDPRIMPDPMALLDSTLVFLYGLFIFPVMAVLASGIAYLTGATTPGFVMVLEVVVAAGTIATTIALFVGYYTAVVTVRFGLDPDNHGIPAVTSAMDFFGVLALALALTGVI